MAINCFRCLLAQQLDQFLIRDIGIDPHIIIVIKNSFLLKL